MGCCTSTSNTKLSLNLKSICIPHSHDPHIASLQSFFKSKQTECASVISEIDDATIARVENYYATEKTIFYENLISGKYAILASGTITKEFEIYAIMAYMHISYGPESPEYKNIQQNMFAYASINYEWLTIYIDTLKNTSIKYVSPSDAVTMNAKTSYTMQNNVKVALFSDWGSGTVNAFNILKSIASQNPDILIHMGDVYYSGTPEEYKNNYVDPIKKYFANTCPNCLILSMPGNHDLYSGGIGYYNALDEFVSNQKTSFFEIHNDYVQIQAFDTAHNDSKVNITNLMQGIANETYVEAEEMQWHIEKINDAVKNNRKLIMLSHHPFIAFNDGLTKKNGNFIPTNERLYNQFKNTINNMTVHFAGHLHNCILYEPYYFNTRGSTNEIHLNERIIGHAGCYNNSNITNLYIPDATIDTSEYEMPVLKSDSDKWKIDTNGETINLGYCILNIADNTITCHYYEIRDTKINDAGTLVEKYTETF